MPHVLFFEPLIQRLKNLNYEILVTTREFSSTIELLESKDIGYTSIGSHQGKSLFSKTLGFFVRVFELIRWLKNQDIDISISHQSPYSTWAAFFLGIEKRVFVFDNEKARFQNFLGMSKSNLNICPKCIPGPYSKYNGFKEQVYSSKFKESEIEISKFGLDKKNYVVFRPEPWQASYYTGNLRRIESLIDILVEHKKIVVLPRDERQRLHYQNKYGKKIIVPNFISDSLSLMFFSSLVISGGGTMNREASMLGIPAISTYEGDLLTVDKWLINNNMMKHIDEYDINSLDLVNDIFSFSITGLDKHNPTDEILDLILGNG